MGSTLASMAKWKSVKTNFHGKRYHKYGWPYQMHQEQHGHYKGIICKNILYFYMTYVYISLI